MKDSVCTISVSNVGCIVDDMVFETDTVFLRSGNWDSRDVPTTWNWNAMDVGPRRDILGDLAKAVKKETSPFTGSRLKFGVYHSLYEWYNPLYLADKASNFTTQNFVDTKTLAELYDLVNKYEPEILWSDGNWEAPSTYWKAVEFLHWYSTNSSVAKTGVWNDRWGSETICKHGDFLTCDDRYNPGSLKKEKWEDAFTIDKTSWGLNRNATIEDYMTVKELVHTLIQVVAFNGNLLLNVGPGADGTISPIFTDRLQGMGTFVDTTSRQYFSKAEPKSLTCVSFFFASYSVGKWLIINGEAIYGTRPWEVCQKESESIFYTAKDDTLYAHFLAWPTNGELKLDCPIPTEETQYRFLGLQRDLGQVAVKLPDHRHGNSASSRVLDSGLILLLPTLTPDIIPCENAWVVGITGLANFK
jgi:alpha-L-fucosidase